MSAASDSTPDLIARIALLERTHSEILLGLQHSMANNSQAITCLQTDMHKLVSLNEQQIILAERAAHTSQAIDRAFGTIKDVRSDIGSMVAQMETNWQHWREKHEEENELTSAFAHSARGGIRVLGFIGVVMWGFLGTIAWDWRDTLSQQTQELERRLAAHRAEQQVRLEALSDQVQELRLSRSRLPTPIPEDPQ